MLDRPIIANLIAYFEALTLAGVYAPFTDVGGAVLRMLAATRGISISDTDHDELTERLASMPPHPEVPAALGWLRDHGFRVFTLSDNTLEISGRQLENAGIIDLFERRFSVDETVHRHKPAPEAYEAVATALDLDPGSICLVACHVWDTLDAIAAGWRPGSSSARATPRFMSVHSRPTSGTTSPPSRTNSSRDMPLQRPTRVRRGTDSFGVHTHTRETTNARHSDRDSRRQNPRVQTDSDGRDL